MILSFSALSGVPIDDLLGKSKKRNVVDARHVYWYLLLKSGFEKQNIAEINGIDRNTLNHAIMKVTDALTLKDANITRLYELTKTIKRNYE